MRTIHIHVHRARDAKFTGEYSAIVKGARQVIKATVEAPDAYQAGDKLRAIFEKKYGPDPMHPTIKFGSASFDPGIAKRTARRAGPEEN